MNDLVRVLLPDQLLLLASAQVIGDPHLPPREGGEANADPLLEPLWNRLKPLSVVFDRLAHVDGWQRPFIRTLPFLGAA